MSFGSSVENPDTLRISIAEVFERIETSNRTMAVLRSAEEAAEEGVRVAKNQRLPELNLSLSFSYIGDAFLTDRDFSGFTWTESPHFGNGFTLDAQQVVYAGGAIDANVEMAGLQAEMALSQTMKSRQGLRLLAVGQYIDLYKIANNIKVYEESISLTQKLIEEIQAKREQGLALSNDVTRYELRLETLRLELVRLKNTASVLNFRLCNTLALPEGEEIVLVPVLDLERDGSDAAPMPLSDWLDEAVRSSPDIRLSSISADMAQSAHKLARSERFPQIALVANESFNGPITFEVPPIDKNLNIWYVGVGLKYNLSSLYKSGSKIRQAAVAARQAAQAVDVAEENLRNDVRQAFTDYRQAYVELETQRKSLQLATENYERVHDRYVEQLAIVTDMLDAFNVKLDAELGVSDAEAEIFYRLCKLKYAAGVL